LTNKGVFAKFDVLLAGLLKIQFF